MQCFDCGARGDNLFEYQDGRKTVRLCAMCKAEREWREQPDAVILPFPEKKQRSPGIFRKIANYFSGIYEKAREFFLSKEGYINKIRDGKKR